MNLYAVKALQPRTGRLLRAVATLGLVSALCAPAWAAGHDEVRLEALTSPELRDRIAQGTTTILVPIGGTEQNGPQMVLGKHNVRAAQLAQQIARQLGRTVVAPVIAYVPEGSIHPPVAHMRYAGTISIPEATFESLLEATARSFKQHGFREVVFLGDHGGYQKNMERVAARLNHEWASDPSCRVLALRQYYEATETSYIASLKAQGFGAAQIGTHAGLADTALSLAVDKNLVRSELLATTAPDKDGVHGDPRRATADLGQAGVQQIVESSVTAIRAAVQGR